MNRAVVSASVALLAMRNGLAHSRAYLDLGPLEAACVSHAMNVRLHGDLDVLVLAFWNSWKTTAAWNLNDKVELGQVGVGDGI